MQEARPTLTRILLVSVVVSRASCAHGSQAPRDSLELLEQRLALRDGVDARVGRRLLLLVELRVQLLGALYRVGDVAAPQLRFKFLEPGRQLQRKTDGQEQTDKEQTETDRNTKPQLKMFGSINQSWEGSGPPLLGRFEHTVKFLF